MCTVHFVKSMMSGGDISPISVYSFSDTSSEFSSLFSNLSDMEPPPYLERRAAPPPPVGADRRRRTRGAISGDPNYPSNPLLGGGNVNITAPYRMYGANIPQNVSLAEVRENPRAVNREQFNEDLIREVREVASGDRDTLLFEYVPPPAETVEQFDNSRAFWEYVNSTLPDNLLPMEANIKCYRFANATMAGSKRTKFCNGVISYRAYLPSFYSMAIIEKVGRKGNVKIGIGDYMNKANKLTNEEPPRQLPAFAEKDQTKKRRLYFYITQANGEVPRNDEPFEDLRDTFDVMKIAEGTGIEKVCQINLKDDATEELGHKLTSAFEKQFKKLYGCTTCCRSKQTN